MLTRIPRQLRVPRIQDLDAGRRGPLGLDPISGAIQSQAENIESGPHVADPAGSKGRHRFDRCSHVPASRNTSLSTPAAVTSSPAPGPVITSGLLWYRVVVKT